MKAYVVPLPVSLKNIASRAGITKAAVSMALRDHPSISVARRAEVQKLAREMGYRPNLLARGLVGKSTRSIGIAWTLGRPISGGIVQDLTIRLWNRGYVTFMANSLSDPIITRQILSDFTQRGVDGVIIEAAGLLNDPVLVGQLKGFKAAVALASEIDDVPVNLVKQVTSYGIRQMLDYWLATGRRRIGFIGEASHDKIEPIRQKLLEFGLPADHVHIVDVTNQPPTVNYFDHYWSALDRTFPRPKEPFPCDAVLCAADGGASALLKWLAHRGLRVPHDVAVAGIGDVDMARGTTPPLASLDRHGDTLSETIEALLFQRLERPDEPVLIKTVPTTFVWRESAGPCPTCLASARKGLPCPLHAKKVV
ncbi:MAG: LacI family DNA-binding transcriptional regulator [Phycisphaerales bacterium]|nr:LacI family DNA-binding transcriptional regulator [Phycisphaerales bacterium]